MNYGKDTSGFSAADQEKLRFDFVSILWANSEQNKLDPNLDYHLRMRSTIANKYILALDRLEKEELKSSEEDGNRDGDIIIRKINAFFNEKKPLHEQIHKSSLK